MSKNSSNNSSNNRNDDTANWVGILIMMIIFWPIGIFLLLKKLRIFSDPETSSNSQRNRANNNNARRNNTGNARNAQGTNQNSRTQGSESTAASEAENIAREVAAELSQAAREAGNAARQVFSALKSDSKSRTWESATGQSQSWQSLASTFTRSSTTETDKKDENDDFATPSQAQREKDSQDDSKLASDTRGVSQENNFVDTSEKTKKSQSSKDTAIAKEERTALDKKSGRFISFILLLISFALFILGARTVYTAAQAIWQYSQNRWFDFYLGVFYLTGGFISFLSRNTVAKRLARYRRYNALLTKRDIVSIEEISQTLGLSSRTVKRDLQAMIDAGYINQDAYINHNTSHLVLSYISAEDALTSAKNAANAANTAIVPDAAQMSSDELVDIPENQYMAIIQELRELNITILDDDISDKIDRIEDVTAMIFRIVVENPEKLPQIRRFMNYYLPTTMKLLRSYATLEKQGINGENITSAKENISRVLEMLASGFEQQFDQLFRSDAIDIAADITVLENLMQQDGLTESEPILKTMEGV
ncbi:MAG: 5-bromo-4-chloroindolyl phosphate hydrolysis family protein [Oscillospiraceae bacterium]|nr:5-bromo-4-chloroindolyl phosphate hydrolysis family protein [Oscillospiraceae bacterium]